MGEIINIKSSSLLSLFFTLLFSTNVFSANVKLAWDPVIDPNLGGYEIHYGLTSNNYTQIVDVGNDTQFEIVNLLEGKTYYFAAVSYNLTKTVKSTFSNEVNKAIPIVGGPTPPPVTGNLLSSCDGYGWSGNATQTSNANRVAISGLNDGNLMIDNPLSNDDLAMSFEAGGVVCNTAITINSLTMINGDYVNGDGVFMNGMTLQMTTDGVTWSVLPWTLSPTYSYNSAAAGGATYTFTGTSMTVKGIRVSGQVKTSQTGDWSGYMAIKELTSTSAPVPVTCVLPQVLINNICMTPNLSPVVSVTAPVTGATFTSGSNITISANATDSDGTIAKVEFYNGTTKLGEDLTSPYSFVIKIAGNYTLSAKAFDNQGATTSSSVVNLTVTAPQLPPVTGQSLFTNQLPVQMSNSDGANVNYELGMRFMATTAGQIKAIKFYKSTSESGAHTGKIYSATGALLASVLFTAETASGWQQQTLSAPLTIAANTEYTVAVNTGNTYYVDTVSGMATQIVSGNIKSIVGSNGVYGSIGTMPINSYQNSNYFRDIIFVASSTPTSLPDTQAPLTSITSPANGTLVSVATSASRKVNITAVASDNVGVSKVEFYVNGSLKCTDVTAAYNCSFSITRTKGVQYKIQVKAYDAAGNMGSSEIVNVISK